MTACGWLAENSIPVLPTSPCALYHTPLLTAAVYICGKALRNLLLISCLPTRIGLFYRLTGIGIVSLG
jgi:hypothetical protein